MPEARIPLSVDTSAAMAMLDRLKERFAARFGHLPEERREVVVARLSGLLQLATLERVVGEKHTFRLQFAVSEDELFAAAVMAAESGSAGA